MAAAPLAVGISLPPNLNSTANSPPQTQVRPLLSQCESIRQLPQIHARILKSGEDRNPLVLAKILRFCSALEATDYATQIFTRIENPDVYHYTALIAGMASAGSYFSAIRLYSRMLAEPINPDAIVISYALKACGLCSALREGRQVHGQVLKLRLSSERAVRMKLIELYGKCGQFSDAKLVFDEMSDRDAVGATVLISCYSDQGLYEEARAVFDRVQDRDNVCWTAMIDGCVRNGKYNAGLDLFREMLEEKIQPNEVTIVCVLSACAQVGALQLGRWIESYVGKHKIRRNAFVSSTLVDMYSKCGSLEEARRVFDSTARDRDVVSYNSMISGLALHGRSSEAVELYQEMVEEGLKPTGITFVGVLNACSHGGLVGLGYEIFESMTRDYGLEPTIEHYGCMVDLLGRIGRLDEACEFIRGMKIEPDHVIWGSLLGACRVHGNLALGEKVARILIGSENADSGTYVLLSNVYACFGKWEEAVTVRAAMKHRGIQKQPGCSSVEVDGEIHEFLLGDIRHPRREEIYQKLEDLNVALKVEGYAPATEAALQDVEEGQKEWALAIHSERLAICFGLIATEPGATIRVVKNLRVCSDCHSMIKLVAKVTGRKIVVRDRKRFHHFGGDGSCSCGDYW